MLQRGLEPSSCTLISYKINKQMLTVVAEARVQHASLKTDFVPLPKTTYLSPMVQQPKQSVLLEKATRPRLDRVKS
ncbi:hypothetical protein Hanom_Chr17g01551781 [Helianthus anomalus]